MAGLQHGSIILWHSTQECSCCWKKRDLFSACSSSCSGKGVVQLVTPQLERCWWQGKSLHLSRWATSILILSPPLRRLFSPNSPEGRVGSSNVPGVCFSPPETRLWLVSEVDLGKIRDSAGDEHPESSSACEEGRQEPTHPQPFYCRASCPEPWRKMNSPGEPPCPDSKQPVSIK